MLFLIFFEQERLPSDLFGKLLQGLRNRMNQLWAAIYKTYRQIFLSPQNPPNKKIRTGVLGLCIQAIDIV